MAKGRKKDSGLMDNIWMKMGALAIVACAIIYTGSTMGWFGSPTETNNTGGTSTTDTTDYTYTPFTLAHVYAYVKDAANKDTAFGADDVYGRVWNSGQFDFLEKTYARVDNDGSAATTGQIDWSAVKMKTNTCYDALFFQGDAGTNLYPALKNICIPKIQADATSTTFTVDGDILLDVEGAFTESALDSATSAWDESGDVVTLNKTATAVEGCLSWDAVLSNSVSGSKIKQPVIVFRDSASSPMTDTTDIQNIYLSVKTGSGIGFFDCGTKTELTGDLASYFTTEVPICVAKDDAIDPQDAATITVKICLESAEANVGTGSFEMVYDDLGDVNAKSLNEDKQAAAETTTFTITT